MIRKMYNSDDFQKHFQGKILTQYNDYSIAE